MTGRSKYTEELLAGLESPERLLSLLADADELLRGHRVRPEAVLLREGLLATSQRIGYLVHHITVNGQALVGSDAGGVDSADDVSR